jgi:hypothetical protein
MGAPRGGSTPPPVTINAAVIRDSTRYESANARRLLASYSGFRGRRAISKVPRHTSTLPQRLGRLNTQRSARRCGARQHAHRRHDDGRDHRRDEEIRGQTVGAPREEQDEAVAGDDAAAELTTGTREHAAEYVPGVGAECETDTDLAGARATATAMSAYRPAAEKTSATSRTLPKTTLPTTIRMPPVTDRDGRVRGHAAGRHTIRALFSEQYDNLFIARRVQGLDSVMTRREGGCCGLESSCWR